MTIEKKDYRLDGIYRQRQEGHFMQRIKLPAGVISSQQARGVAALARDYGQGRIHLTTRGSMEIHWLREADLPALKRALTTYGLTSRGACGGAVRGITCSSQGSQRFPVLETLARRLQRHFSGNPRFERLPKKFKVGIEANVTSGRHLIQDVGLVLARLEEGRAHYDVWVAGGLGRAPQAAFLLAEDVDERRIIPLVEAIATVYAANVPPGRRLKSLAGEIGEEGLRRLIHAEPGAAEELPPVSGLPEHLIPIPAGRQRLEARLFAGLLTSDQLLRLADFADSRADGALMVTPDQDVAFLLAHGIDGAAAASELEEAGFNRHPASGPPVFRVCPGSHECLAGLAPTRDVARAVLEVLGPAGATLSWAVSGCPNSCTQPQLADAGIAVSRLTAEEGGEKAPRFDLYRRTTAGLGHKVGEHLTLGELRKAVRRLG